MTGFKCPDVLGDILDSIPMKSTVWGPLTFQPPWGIYTKSGDIQYYIVNRGRCLLEVDRISSSAELGQGDLVLLTQKRSHRLCDALTSTAVCLEEEASAIGLRGKDNIKSDRPSTSILAGSIAIDPSISYPILSLLPPVVHIKRESGDCASRLNGILKVMTEEIASPRSGTQMIVNRLSQIIFIYAVRTYMSRMASNSDNQLSALFDPEIGQALRCIHQNPGRPWTVASLADEVGLSRSTFAAKFCSLVGMPPLHYLLEYRMRKACDILRTSPKGIKEIAIRMGYASEAAFGNAFKRWSGTSPGSFRKNIQLQD